MSIYLVSFRYFDTDCNWYVDLFRSAYTREKMSWMSGGEGDDWGMMYMWTREMLMSSLEYRSINREISSTHLGDES